MKAADIPDDEILGFIRDCNEGRVPGKYFPYGEERWCFVWDLEERFPQYPWKVLMAKIKKLHKRGLIGGCTCGCRGDFAVADSPMFY